MEEKLKRWVPFSAFLDISLLTSGQFFLYFFGFLYGVFAARVLGPSKLGRLALIIANVRLIASPFFLRFGSPLVKMVKRRLSNENQTGIYGVISGAVWLQLGTSLLFGLVFAVFVFILPPYWELFRDWQIALSFYAGSEMIRLVRKPGPIFKAYEQFGYVAVIRSMNALLRNFVPVIFMFWGVQAACLGYLMAEIGLLLVVVIMIWWFRDGKLLEGFNFDVFSLSDTLYKLYLNSRSNYLADILKVIFGQIQPLMIGQMIGTREVGFYNIGQKALPLYRFIAKPVRQYLFPRFVDKWERDKKEFFFTFRKYIYQSSIIFSGLGLLVVGISPWFIPYVYGTSFVPSVPVVFIFAPVVVLNGIFYIFRPVAFSVSKARAIFNVSILRVIIGIPLMFFFTLNYSYLGMAWAFTIMNIITTIYKTYFFQSNFGSRWLIPERT